MIFEKDIAGLKLSSATILNENGVGIDPDAITECSNQIAEVHNWFHPLIILGGAVGAGRGFLELNGLDHRRYDPQSLASYGTAEVSLALRDELMKSHGIKTGQVLANHDQATAGSVLIKGLVHGMVRYENVYHINENDQENLFELDLLEEEEKTVRSKQTGVDNDPLASQIIIALIEELRRQGVDRELACHLVMFTKIGGFVVEGAVEAEISASNKEAIYNQCNGVSDTGSGGMRVKVEACFDAVEAGAESVQIASPDQNWLHVIEGKGEVGKFTRVVQ